MAKKKNMRGSDEVSGEVDMSPMIDCCFLLLIFFVVNATAITVSKDPNVKMPSAVASSDLKDAKGCIVVNIFRDVDKITDPKAKARLLKDYPKAGIWWSTGEKTASGAAIGFTKDEERQLAEYIKKQKEIMQKMVDRGAIKPEQIRLYLRGDTDAPWERTAAAIRVAAAEGVNNIVFGTYPSK